MVGSSIPSVARRRFLAEATLVVDAAGARPPLSAPFWPVGGELKSRAEPYRSISERGLLFAVHTDEPVSNGFAVATPRGGPASWQMWSGLLLAFLCATEALGHGVADKDAQFVAASSGPQVMPFLYLGAKHMVTGYDHLLFLVGVIFLLFRLKDIALYVTLFSIGHSVTLLAGVLGGVHANGYFVDAVIGLSVAYKAFDNLGGFKRVLGVQPSTKAATLLFGLVHGFGLATKLQDLKLSPDGLLVNMISFNVGVELGQLAALGLILVAMTWWRWSPSFNRHAIAANGLLMTAGFILVLYQLTGYFIQGAV